MGTILNTGNENKVDRDHIKSDKNIAMDWIVPSSNSYVEAPRLNEVIRMGPRSYRISVLIRRDTRELALSLIATVPFSTLHTIQMSTQTEGSHLQASLIHSKRSHTRNQSCHHPDLRFPASRTVRKQISVVEVTSLGILLWQTKQTKISIFFCLFMFYAKTCSK